MATTYILSVSYMIYTGISYPFFGPKGVRLLLFFRGFSGFVGLLGIYYSLQYLSLSDATVLTFLAPLTSAVAAAILLGESFTLNQALASITSLVGVVLIARPSFLFHAPPSSMPEKTTVNERIFAVMVSLIGVSGMTGAYISIRALGRRIHALHAMVAFSFQSVIGSSIGMLIQRKPIVIPTQWVWLGCLFIIGFFGFFAQVLLTLGLQREKIAIGTMALYTQVIFAILLEFFFFGTLPSFYSAIGIVLIIFPALYVASSKPQKSHAGSNNQTTEEYPSQACDPEENSSSLRERCDETTVLLGTGDRTERSYT